MKLKLHPKTSFISVLLASSLIGIWLGVAQGAGSASMTLSPSSGSHDINTTFTVTISENSGAEAVNSVEADLTYDASKLQFVSIDTGSSAFAIGAAATGGGGSVSIQMGTAVKTTLTGNQTVGSVTFKVLVGSGTTSVTFANSSLIYKNSDNTDIWNHSNTGGTYTLTTPTASTPALATPATTPTTSGGSSSGSTTKTTTTTKTSTTGPSAAQQAANPAAPVPVANPTEAAAGYLVGIKVVDSKGKPVADATVTLDNKTAKSDVTGLAGFIGVTAGKHSITVKSSQGTVKSDVTVSNQKPLTEVQTFTAKVGGKSPIMLIVEIGIGIVILIGLGLLAATAVKKLNGRKSSSMSLGGGTTENIVTFDVGKSTPPPAPTQVFTPTPAPTVTPTPAPTVTSASAPAPTTQQPSQPTQPPTVIIPNDPSKAHL